MGIKRFIRIIAGSTFLFVGIIYVAYLSLGIPDFIYYNNFQFFLLYFVPKVVPFFVIGLYLLTEKPMPKLNFLYKSIVAITVGTAIIVSIAAIMINWVDLTWILTEDYNWSVAGWLVWNYAFIAFFFISYFRLHDIPFSFTFAALGISAGGLLYEIPVAYQNYQLYYHSTFPLFVNTQWISLVFLGWMFYSKRLQLNKVILFGLFAYFVGSIVYFVFGNGLSFSILYYMEWLPRIPTVAMLVLLPFGLKKVQEIHT